MYNHSCSNSNNLALTLFIGNVMLTHEEISELLSYETKVTQIFLAQTFDELHKLKPEHGYDRFANYLRDFKMSLKLIAIFHALGEPEELPFQEILSIFEENIPIH